MHWAKIKTTILGIGTNRKWIAYLISYYKL